VNNTDHHDIAEILLKVALNTINQIILHRVYQTTDGAHLMPVIWGMELVSDNLQQLLRCNKLLEVVDDGPLQDIEKSDPVHYIILCIWQS